MIFPTFAQKRMGGINLDRFARTWLPAKYPRGIPEKNPLLIPEICQLMVTESHEFFGLDYSYDGWLVDRSYLWKDSYLEREHNFIHLGIDINAPAGTLVAIDQEAEVMRIDDDTPEEHGWGNRVIFKLLYHDIALIYAHLDPEILCHVGQVLHPGKMFAKLGSWNDNGWFYTHCHVQAVVWDDYLELLKGNLKGLDGYGNVKDIQMLARRFPDPMKYISLA